MILLGLHLENRAYVCSINDDDANPARLTKMECLLEMDQFVDVLKGQRLETRRTFTYTWCVVRCTY